MCVHTHVHVYMYIGYMYMRVHGYVPMYEHN